MKKLTVLFLFFALAPAAFAQKNFFGAMMKKLTRSASEEAAPAAKQAGSAVQASASRAAKTLTQKAAAQTTPRAAETAPVWTQAERMRAFHKVRNAVPRAQYATTFYRFAMDAEDWFVSGDNVVLHGRKEIAKYMEAARQGVKDIPVKDGKVQLNLTADLSREGVDYRVFTRPSQLAAPKQSQTPKLREWDEQNMRDLLSGEAVDFNELDRLNDNL